MARTLLKADCSEKPIVPGVRSHCRFRHRGTEYVSESGLKWMDEWWYKATMRPSPDRAVEHVAEHVGAEHGARLLQPRHAAPQNEIYAGTTRIACGGYL
jgi:hypothetical protein